MSGNVTEAVSFSNIAATTVAFQLKGGKYMLTVSGTFSSGNVAVQTLAGDGSTWLSIGTAATAAQVATFDLAPGQYRFAIASSVTAAYLVIASVPSPG